MTPHENIQRIKNETLNKIIKFYHPETKHGFTYYEGEGSFHEQLSYKIEYEIEQMQKQIQEIKHRTK